MFLLWITSHLIGVLLFHCHLLLVCHLLLRIKLIWVHLPHVRIHVLHLHLLLLCSHLFLVLLFHHSLRLHPIHILHWWSSFHLFLYRTSHIFSTSHSFSRLSISRGFNIFWCGRLFLPFSWLFVTHIECIFEI